MKRQVHGRNALIRQNHAIVCKIQLVAVIEVVLVIEIAVKDTRPILDDCPGPGDVTRQHRRSAPPPGALPRGASSLQDEALLADTLIGGVVCGMKNHAQLAATLHRQSLTSGDLLTPVPELWYAPAWR